MLFQLAQLAVSLIAILLLALLARQLGLGGDVRLRTRAQALDEAAAALGGFEAVDVALDRAGIGALLRDSQGRVLLLRRHGAQFAARLLDSHADTRLDRNFLTIGTGDTSFGKVTLDLGDKAQVWAASLRRLGT
ncbi:MAG: hypothetical protein IPG83_15160 [Novosphingobium sp.]|jgi:hypothetical protein|nr:hypothetical protein [Novosphingobium sp.]